MTKRLYGARRHIKEWTEFFRDTKIITEKLADEFIKQHKKNKYLKQSFKRLIERGVIQRKENKFIVTTKGRVFFIKNNVKKDLNNNTSKKKWDGKWRLISFDVPIRDNSKRAFLRGLLKEFNFYPIQKSVWICPDYLAKKFWELLIHYELDKYCKVMLVEFMEGDEELKKYFKLASI